MCLDIFLQFNTWAAEWRVHAEQTTKFLKKAYRTTKQTSLKQNQHTLCKIKRHRCKTNLTVIHWINAWYRAKRYQGKSFLNFTGICSVSYFLIFLKLFFGINVFIYPFRRLYLHFYIWYRVTDATYIVCLYMNVLPPNIKYFDFYCAVQWEGIRGIFYLPIIPISLLKSKSTINYKH